MTSAVLLMAWMAWQGPEWAGTWRGPLVNFDAVPSKRTVEATFDIGEIAAKDGECSKWRMSFKTSGGAPDVVKDHQLCRVNDQEFYFQDAKGVKLSTRFVGGLLVTPHKVNTMILVQTLRVHGDTLEQEIITLNDKAADTGVVPMETRHLQRITLKRVK